jgi:hypothetical protein
MNLQQTLDREHKVSSLLGLTGMANDMADQEEAQLKQEELSFEGNDGEMHEEPASESEEAENFAEKSIKLMNQVAKVNQQLKMYEKNSDSTQ